MFLRMKFESNNKMEKSKRKRAEDELEYRKMSIDKHIEKNNLVCKRRDQLRDQFDKSLKAKEDHYKQRMQLLIENRKNVTALESDYLSSKMVAGDSKLGGSELGDSKVIPKERAKTAMNRFRATSSNHESLLYFEEDEEEEELR